MEVSYNVEVPRISGRGRSKYAHIIREFLDSGNENICFSFDEYKPTRTAYIALSQLSRRTGTFKAIMRGCSVICVKEDKEKNDQD